MAVKFKDYYEILGVARGATQDEIQRAYRKLARQFHPDVNKSKDAETRFKEASEAYEVLKDPEKRKKYDTLGANWKAGQDFTPPPGWEPRGGFGGNGGGHRPAAGGEGFSFDASDFFEAFFGRGGAAGSGPGGFQTDAGGFGAGMQDTSPDEAEVTVSLEDAYRGGTRQIQLGWESGRGEPTTKTFDVKIPAGTAGGSRIRLAGQGRPLRGGGQRDIVLTVRLAPDPRFEVAGHDLTTELPLTASEAVLGAKVPVRTLDGEVTLAVPAGSQTGQRLRLRGRGLPRRGGDPGDLFARLKIVVPKAPSPREKELYEALQRESSFNPRLT